jgi:hypothetical protein
VAEQRTSPRPKIESHSLGGEPGGKKWSFCGPFGACPRRRVTFLARTGTSVLKYPPTPLLDHCDSPIPLLTQPYAACRFDVFIQTQFPCRKGEVTWLGKARMMRQTLAGPYGHSLACAARARRTVCTPVPSSRYAASRLEARS